MDRLINIYDEIPTGLLDCNAQEIHKVLPRPSLIHLPGQKDAPLFISILLHGNEYSGWFIIKKLLNKYLHTPLPRAVSLFVGNIWASKEDKRCLENQLDYNRIWSGGNEPEHLMAQQVLEEMKERNVFISLDLHNTSGKNAHYAGITQLDPVTKHIASLFSQTVVYFTQPDSVQSRAFSSLCPSVTLECGLSGQSESIVILLTILMNACKWMISRIYRQKKITKSTFIIP